MAFAWDPVKANTNEPFEKVVRRLLREELRKAG